MSRTNRIALLAAAVLLVALAGTVFATRQPQADDQPAQLTDETDETDADALARAAERLGVDQQQLQDLATTYGLGGAVRLVAWSSATGTPIEDIRAMRDGDGTEGSGMGWGRIAKELGVKPGIGSIMGNGNPSPGANAPGQEKHDSDDGSGG
jgi:hypothetical protein